MSMRTTIWAVAAILCLLAGLPAADTYRWEDEEGRKHYGDHVPPEAAQRGRVKLDDSGRVIDSIEGAKTPEELETQRREAAREAQRRTHEYQQARRDRMLLDTFATEEELETARDNRLAIVDAALATSATERDLLIEQLDAIDERARRHRRKNGVVPERLETQARRLRERFHEMENVIERKRTERESIEERFAKDLERYRELQQRESGR